MKEYIITIEKNLKIINYYIKDISVKKSIMEKELYIMKMKKYILKDYLTKVI